MTGILEKQELLSDLANLEALIAQASENEDIVSEMSFRDRHEFVEEQIQKIDANLDHVAEVALIFEGQTVTGSRAIDASFAAHALSIFQEIISKIFADRSEEGLRNPRGGIPLKDISGFQITGTAHGSFGFVLEERDAGQDSMVPTALRETLDEALATMSVFYSEQDSEYNDMLEIVNPRVFAAVKDFYSLLYKSESVIKIASKKEITTVTDGLVQKAYDRSIITTIEDNVSEITGTLIGIGPVKRTFEFQPDDRTDKIVGRIGSKLSSDYLERIEQDQDVTLGTKFWLKLQTRRATRPTGAENIIYTALDLEARG